MPVATLISLTPVAACNVLAGMPAGTLSMTAAAEAIETDCSCAFVVGSAAEPVVAWKRASALTTAAGAAPSVHGSGCAVICGRCGSTLGRQSGGGAPRALWLLTVHADVQLPDLGKNRTFCVRMHGTVVSEAW